MCVAGLSSLEDCSGVAAVNVICSDPNAAETLCGSRSPLLHSVPIASASEIRVVGKTP